MGTSNGRAWTGRLVSALSIVLAGCVGPSTDGGLETTWLSPATDERWVQLERQLRGFDLAMVETGHRYTELFWAGRDGNWEAAGYHVRKMRLSIENGLERRPKRATSAESFLEGPLGGMEEAVASRDHERFETRFRALTAACNACHAAEQVAFFEVQPPTTRTSPIRRSSRTPE